MPRNLFLSFPGTNNYVECNYHPEGKPEEKIENVKYVQEALIQLYCQDFGSEDALYFFLTADSRSRNWENDGQFNKETKQYNLPNRGLAERLEGLRDKGLIRAAVNPVSIPEGFSTEQVWDIFQTVYDCLQPGDRVILDITHAFRSLPMLGMALIHYAKALKQIEVAGIYYGAFEKLGPAPVVAKWPLEERNAPILNLQSFSELQDWTAAAHDFVQYGKPDKWNTLANKKIDPILKETQGGDEVARNIRDINTYIQQLTPILNTNRGAELLNFRFDRLNEILNNFSADRSYIKPLNPIVEEVKQKVAPFFNAGPLSWMEGVNWCIQHELIQQGITQLQEGLLTWLCQYFDELQIAGDFFDWKKEPPRTLLSSALSFLPGPPHESEWGGPIGKHKEIGKRVLRFPLIKRLATTYQDLGRIRNDINHGGYTRTTKASDFSEALRQYAAEINKIITLEAEVLGKEPSGLLNLSNHPASGWPDNQKKLGRELYGSIDDLPFPQIDPDWSHEKVEALADDYFNRVLRRRPAAVHLMGEMTFTLALVQRLKAAGILCLASTTNRLVKEENGQKIVRFQFVRFRAY